MATRRTSRPQAPPPERLKRKGPDPTGRVDILLIRLLQTAVELHGDLPLRGIYGTYQREINRAIRQHLGKVKFHMDGLGRVQLGGPRVR